MADYDVDVDMSDGHSFGHSLEQPPSSRELDQLQYHICLQDLGKTLQKAAEAAFPNDRRLRYSTVYVLLLCWEDEDPKLPVDIEVIELKEVFESTYNFAVDVWKIPSEGSHKRLNQKILNFVEVGGDCKDHLKIVYYGGHGVLSHSRQSSWTSRPDPYDPRFRMVKWSGIQHALEEAESDVLLLLDCCASGTANTDTGKGITELIAACGFNSSANPVGPDSFTRALITELKLLEHAPAFTIGALYNKILCRVQNWMPLGREMQKPPLHVVLTQNPRLPQSIQLSRFRGSFSQGRSSSSEPQSFGSFYTHDVSSQGTTSSSATSGNSPEPTSSSRSSLSNFQSPSPTMAITIRLKETLSSSELDGDEVAEWLRLMPVVAEHVRIEAGFLSWSTLLLVSLPVDMWCYLDYHPAITLSGFVKSKNLVRAPNYSSHNYSRERKPVVSAEEPTQHDQVPRSDAKAVLDDFKEPSLTTEVVPPTACTFCRSKHIKCDGLYPCSRCFSKSLECLYMPSNRFFKGSRQYVTKYDTFSSSAEVRKLSDAQSQVPKNMMAAQQSSQDHGSKGKNYQSGTIDHNPWAEPLSNMKMDINNSTEGHPRNKQESSTKYGLKDALYTDSKVLNVPISSTIVPWQCSLLNLAPLELTQSKDALLKHLDLSLETYALMAKETDRVYNWLASEQNHLKKDRRKRSPPYDWSDIDEHAKDQAIVNLAQNGDKYTDYYWKLGSMTDDHPNWVARWFLYHKFRYRDGRNRKQKRGEASSSRALRSEADPVDGGPLLISECPAYSHTCDHGGKFSHDHPKSDNHDGNYQIDQPSGYFDPTRDIDGDK